MGIGIAGAWSRFGLRSLALAPIGAAAALALCAGDLSHAGAADALEAHPVDSVSLSPAPEWGPGAFETVRDIEIVPR